MHVYDVTHDPRKRRHLSEILEEHFPLSTPEGLAVITAITSAVRRHPAVHVMVSLATGEVTTRPANGERPTISFISDDPAI